MFKKNPHKEELKKLSIPYKKSVFIQHVREQSIDIVKLFLDAGMSPNVKDNESIPVLHIAAEKRNYDIVKLLLDYNARVDINNKYTTTALEIASRKGDYDTAKLLIDHGAESNAYCLVEAAEKGYLEIVKLHIEIGADLNKPSWRDDTPLKKAMSHPKVFQYLLEQGANPNIQYSRTSTLLEQACNYKNMKIFHLLIKHNVNVNANQNSYQSPLILAMRGGYAENEELVKVLIAKGADVKQLTGGGSIPSVRAASAFSDVSIFRLFIEKGADVNAKDAEGNSALSEAAAYGHNEIMKYLLDNGADINSTNQHGYTALMKAVAAGEQETVKLLLEKGASTEARDKATGDTAFSLAEDSEDSKLIKLIKEAGKGKKGNSS